MRFWGLAIDLPVHGEVLFRPDRPVLGRQITHVTIRGQHGVTGAKVFPNGLSLGRGLDDQYVHRRNMLQLRLQ